MTISSLSKMVLGVKNIVVEKVEAEQPGEGLRLIIHARPHKRDMCRCGICVQKSPRYDCGNGVRRWRAPDLGSGIKVYVEAEAPRVCCPEHGVVVQQFPWSRHHSKFKKLRRYRCLAFASSVTQSSLRVSENQLGHSRTNHLPCGKRAVRESSAVRQFGEYWY